ncbi:MAG TPA: hypothetical protein VMJ10_04685 [Kofleriaceae bacterium]|nr:hypothetical protein [Kofleriaceae bacterium]
MSSFEDIPVEPDRGENRIVPYVLAGTLLAIVACACVVVLSLHGATGGGRSRVVDLRELPPATPFDSATPLELEQRARAVRLEHWQWADRGRGVVLVPVAVAIDRYVRAHEERTR